MNTPLAARFPSLLDISNGLPPPLPESALEDAFLVVEDVLLVDVKTSFVLVAVIIPVPGPSSVDFDELEVEAAAVVSVDSMVVDLTIRELDGRLVDLRLVVVTADCAIGVDFDEVVDMTTPGLAVGIVTESTAVGWALS